ncbi:MAG: 3-mercaptopyruvate sulfurtransferase [Pseudomonadota bacterium]
MTRSDALVSTAWLADSMGAPDLKVADATWFLPPMGRDARQEYREAHIPGAVYFDIDDIADTASDLPHMVPDAAKFSSRVRDLGLGDGTRIVLYDNNRYSASARAWWMFRLFGHNDVAVLDGGLAKWRSEGRPVDDAEVNPSSAHFTARLNNLLLRDLEQMRANLMSKHELVIDARSSGRFAGTESEPRAGLRSGHIPGSVCVPFLELIEADGTLASQDVLRRRFADAGIDQQPLATTCGSGVTACTLALALYDIGRKEVAVYDGSWTEWGGRSDTPVET